MESLLDTWRINTRVNRRMLSAISEEQLKTQLAKGKSVADHFAHINNVRLMWIKASAPELYQEQTKLEKDPTHEQIASALDHSDKAIEQLIATAKTPEGRIKNFKPHVSAFVGYLLSHEAYHRAQAELALRQAGTPLPDKDAYALWEWGVI